MMSLPRHNIDGDPMSLEAGLLVKTAIAAGCGRSSLVEGAKDPSRCWTANTLILGLSAAASVPDEGIEEVCVWLCNQGFAFNEMAEVK